MRTLVVKISATDANPVVSDALHQTSNANARGAVANSAHDMDAQMRPAAVKTVL